MTEGKKGVRALWANLAAQRRARRVPKRSADASFGQLRVSWLMLVVVAIVVGGVLVLARPVGLLIEQRQTIAGLEQQVAAQQQRVDGLQAEVARWDDPAYIEAQARDRLFYVYPGETSFVVLDDRTTVQAGGGDERFSTELQSTELDWMQASLTSLVLAGVTEASPEQLSKTGQIAESQ